MAPLVILIVTYAVGRLTLPKRSRRRLAGRVALAVMLAFTSVAHFTSTEALVAMVPPPVPAPVLMVYATGIAEGVFALLLLARPTAGLAWALVLFFLALLPANVYAAVEEVGLGGHGPAYLWFRVPLQFLFMGWALVCTGAVRVPWKGRSCAALRRP